MTVIVLVSLVVGYFVGGLVENICLGRQRRLFLAHVRFARLALESRGECPCPEGNVCEHGLQWDLNLCPWCMSRQIASAVEALRRIP